jgi:hypothetical protein
MAAHLARNNGLFLSDTRNVGGKHAVIDTMMSHQAGIRRQKAADRSANADVTRNKLSAKVKPARTMVFNGGKRATARAAVDTSAPRTLHLSQQLSAARRKRRQRERGMHNKNLKTLVKRCEEYPTRQHRVRNANDPIAHPVKVLRVCETNKDYDFVTASAAAPRGKRLFHADPLAAATLRPVAAPTAVSNPNLAAAVAKTKVAAAAAATPHSQSQSQWTNATLPRRPLRALRSAWNNDDEDDRFAVGASVAIPTRLCPSTALPIRVSDAEMHSIRRDKASRDNANGDNSGGGRYRRSHTRGSAAAQRGEYERLRSKMFKLAHRHRIFREADLVALCERCAQLNAHLDPALLEEMLNGLLDELVVPDVAYADASAGLNNPVATQRRGRGGGIDVGLGAGLAGSMRALRVGGNGTNGRALDGNGGIDDDAVALPDARRDPLLELWGGAVDPAAVARGGVVTVRVHRLAGIERRRRGAVDVRLSLATPAVASPRARERLFAQGNANVGGGGDGGSRGIVETQRVATRLLHSTDNGRGDVGGGGGENGDFEFEFEEEFSFVVDDMMRSQVCVRAVRVGDDTTARAAFRSQHRGGAADAYLLGKAFVSVGELANRQQCGASMHGAFALAGGRNGRGAADADDAIVVSDAAVPIAYLTLHWESRPRDVVNELHARWHEHSHRVNVIDTAAAAARGDVGGFSADNDGVAFVNGFPQFDDDAHAYARDVDTAAKSPPPTSTPALLAFINGGVGLPSAHYFVETCVEDPTDAAAASMHAPSVSSHGVERAALNNAAAASMQMDPPLALQRTNVTATSSPTPRFAQHFAFSVATIAVARADFVARLYIAGGGGDGGARLFGEVRLPLAGVSEQSQRDAEDGVAHLSGTFAVTSGAAPGATLALHLKLTGLPPAPV